MKIIEGIDTESHVSYNGVNYIVSKESDVLNIILIPKDKKKEIHIPVGSVLFFKIFPGICVPEVSTDITVISKEDSVSKYAKSFTQGGDNTIILDSDYEETWFSELLGNLQESLSKKAKKEYLQQFLNDNEDKRVETLFMLQCCINRKSLYALSAEELVKTVKTNKVTKFTEDYTEEFSECVNKYLDYDEEISSEEYQELVSLIPKRDMFNWIVTINGFNWYSIGINNKDLNNIIDTYSETEELEDL